MSAVTVPEWTDRAACIHTLGHHRVIPTDTDYLSCGGCRGQGAHQYACPNRFIPPAPLEGGEQ